MIRLSLLLLVAALSLTVCLGGPPSSILLSNRDGSNMRLASVGRVRANFTCSGALIRQPSATPESPAYVLTSGHCISLDPFTVITDRPVNYTVEFNYFADTRDSVIPIRATRVIWSTMKGTDLALLELDATLGQLAARDLEPHPLSASPPPGSPVWWAGMPSSFIPTGETFLRRGSCSLAGAVTLIEDRWLWFDQLRNDCPDIYATASGSPLFDSAGAIIGVIGTSTTLSSPGGPDFDCFRNRPCEITARGAAVEEETSYASPVFPLTFCFVNGRFDLEHGCPLDGGVHLIPDTGRVTATQPFVDGRPARWNVRLTGTLSHYAWKQVPLGGADCRDSSGYSAPLALASAPIITAELETRDGGYLLCIVAGNTPSIGDSWQPFRHATIVRRTVDSEPLTALPVYSVDFTGIAYRVTFFQQAPALRAMEFKRGDLPSVHCANPDGYRTLFSVPPVIFEREFPHRLCVRFADEAGNWSPPMQFDFGPPSLQPFGLKNLASLNRARSIARGSLFRMDTIELTRAPRFADRPVLELAGVRAQVVDSAGARHQVLLSDVGLTHLDGLIPPAAALGKARMTIFPPGARELEFEIEVSETSPGLFAANFSGVGPPLGYQIGADGSPAPLFDCRPPFGQCETRAVTLDPTRTAELLFHGTGLTGAKLTAKLGTEDLEVMGAEPNREWPGVDSLRLRIPAGFGLRGYQVLRAGDDTQILLLR